MDDNEFDRAVDALQRLLPEDLRDDWLILPRRSLHQVAIACLLLGAAIALLIAGIVLDKGGLVWGFPLVLAAMALATRFMPWWRRGDRLVEQWHEASKGGGP